MKRISIDVTKCRTTDELFVLLLARLGAPDWHGHNLNALWDSVTSDINRVMPPYTIEVVGAHHVPEDVLLTLEQIQSVFDDARAERALDVSFTF